MSGREKRCRETRNSTPLILAPDQHALFGKRLRQGNLQQPQRPPSANWTIGFCTLPVEHSFCGSVREEGKIDGSASDCVAASNIDELQAARLRSARACRSRQGFRPNEVQNIRCSGFHQRTHCNACSVLWQDSSRAKSLPQTGVRFPSGGGLWDC